MLGLDPNWFYSSLAQSAAAIVGLLGGIFATRLQYQIMASREQRLRTIRALQGLYDRLTALHTPLREYLKHTDAQVQLLRDQLASGASRLEQQVWYAHVEKSPTASVEVSDRMIRIEEERTRDAKLLLPLVAAALDANSIPAVHQLEHRLANSMKQFSDQTTHQANGVLETAQLAARELGILALRSSTRPSWVLWWCLAVLSIFGVVIPLCFLASYAGWHKAALVVVFGAALIVLLGYLCSQVKHLGRSAEWHSMLPPDDQDLA